MECTGDAHLQEAVGWSFEPWTGEEHRLSDLGCLELKSWSPSLMDLMQL